jgi:hypothetical protein
MKTLTLSILASEAAVSLSQSSVLYRFPINDCFSRTTFNPFVDYMLFMTKLLKLDTNKVISAIFEIICMDFHLTMIIGRSARHFKW